MVAVKVMIASDSPLSTLSLRVALEELGYPVVGTSSIAHDAIQLAERLQPDILLVDCHSSAGLAVQEAARIITNRLLIPVAFLGLRPHQDNSSTPPLRPSVIAATIEDALRKHRLHSRLQASHEQYRRVVEDCSYVFWAINHKGILTYASPPIRELLGYSYPELVGRPVVDLLHPADQSRWNRAFIGSRRHRSGQDEYRFIHQDGRVRWFQASWHRILSKLKFQLKNEHAVLSSS